ncbi:MAG: S-layer protein [Candidatus Micrarchaeota archaeon]|nr:S-layer protein [Candidatus Micrarchaeota archaeon]
MKSLNAKRIAAVAAGAALLGVGLAFAGQITFQNVPIISNSGQPLVQIVVGSSAQPSDGVAAGNVAAAIGNLAYTSVPVTASINATQAMGALKVAVSSSKYSLTNQKVWLNETGTTGTGAGTYSFAALIGSVLNGAVILGTPQNTKLLQSSGQYAFQESTSLTISPPASPYTAAGSVPTSTSVTANTNGGGVSFTSFSKSGFDNIMQVTNAQLSQLLSNSGSAGETETLWLTGFPVFNQGTPGSLVNQFQLIGAGGAYQAVFNKPIQFQGFATTSARSQTNLNTAITLLGQNWTILGGFGAGSAVIGSTATVAGGKVQLAASLTPLTTVYVGRNISSGANFTVALQDLGLANSNGVSPASIAVYYQGKLTNQTSVFPGNTAQFNVSGHKLFVKVNQTFAGYYQYQKWAKLQAYANVYNVTNGQVFNQTNNPGWYATLLWTNTTSAASANAVALQSIILYNTTPTTLTQGQSFSFIQKPSAYKLTFVGETLTTGGFDALTAAAVPAVQVQYQNVGASGPGAGLTIKNVTEPAAELLVTSQIPSAFSYAGQTGSTVTYNLNPYDLNEFSNSMPASANFGTNAFAPAGLGLIGTTNQVFGASNIILVYNNAGAGANTWVSSTNPLTVTVTGYTSNSASATPQTQSVVFTSNDQGQLTTSFYNVTGIKLNRALPGGPLQISVLTNALTAANALAANVMQLAQLTNVPASGAIMYPASNTNNYQNALSVLNAASNQVIYNQQNGQATSTLTLASTWDASQASVGVVSQQQYYTYTINEVAVPTNTLSTDTLAFGIGNSTSGTTTSAVFQLNYSANFGSNGIGTRNNMTYMSTASGSSGASNKFDVQPGFRTERGSKFASVSPSQLAINLAKAIDTLQFAVSPGTTTIAKGTAKTIGPFGIGQAVTGIANLTIANVSATIGLGSASNYTISGISNIIATPSVTQAVTPVWLKNLTTTPLVVLDSQANSGSNLVLIGSGYVNTLSAQLQKAYNVSVTPTFQQTQAYGTNRVLVAGYTAAQTTAAANAFIQNLYAAASSS